MQTTNDIAIINTNADGLITEFNDGAQKLLNYSSESLQNKKLITAIFNQKAFQQQASLFCSKLGRNLSGFDVIKEVVQQNQYIPQEWRFQCADDKFIDMHLTITIDKKNNSYRFVATPLQKEPSRFELKDLTSEDVCIKLMKDELSRMQRSKQSIGLLKIAVAKTDEETQKSIAQIVNNRIQRSGDTLAFFSDQSFVAMLPNTDLSGTLKLAETLRLQINLTQDDLEVSVGLANIIPDINTTPADFIPLANKALSRAKKEGGIALESRDFSWSINNII